MLITLIINPTTGKEFTIEIDNETTIEDLKRILAKKLKVGREVISLLHMNGLLTTGTLASHDLTTGSTLRLVPCIETGILTPRPEQSVLEALESLNDTQVSDFLTGKSPLNLTMRLGEHVMLIQLQLSKGLPLASAQSSQSTVSISKQQASSTTSSSNSSSNDSEPGPSKPNLSEASRSLTNTLKKLSSTVSKEDDLSKHMHHHGKGIYSGTFSGTLNPVLQDPAGKPKKHVSTIVHILNDLLGGVDLKSCTSSGKGQFISSNSQPTKRKSTETATSSSNSSSSNSSSNSSTATSSPTSSSSSASTSSSGIGSPIPEKVCKVADQEENIILKSKMDKLLNELKLKKKEMLARHNIKS